MSTVLYTGRKPLLRPRLLAEIQNALQADEMGEVLVITPEPLTLETELFTLRDLQLAGSFRLSVLSPKRLCARVFDEAGRPAAACVDERGRAMLMGRALTSLQKELKWYAGAKDRRGFEMRVVKQIIHFKQAGVTPEDVAALAESAPEGALGLKLHDLAILYRAYEDALAGRFQDGEDELAEAEARMPRAPFLGGARVFVFGYDITTHALNRFLSHIGLTCASMGVFLPMENDARARDYPLYLPMLDSYDRLTREMTKSACVWKRECLFDGAPPANACAHFAREAFCAPVAPFRGRNASVQLARLNNPMDEARFSAALARRLVMKNNWRYSDILILCEDMPAYAGALETAFQEYDVPIFLGESRPADKHALPRYLIETLKLLSGGAGDLGALFETGYACLEQGEADALLAYAARVSLRPRDILKPFKRGDRAQALALEPLRQKLAAPILRLNEALVREKTLYGQLGAVFNYLLECDCPRKGEEMRARLVSMGLRTLAAEDAQVWNRLVGALDQMHELMGEARLGKAQLTDLIARAMSAEMIKPLPQYGDAVNAVSAARAGAVGAKALIVLGAAAGGENAEDALLARAEASELALRLEKHLGPDALSRTRTARMHVKDALSLAEEYLCVTDPVSLADGSSAPEGPLTDEIRRVFPGIPTRGGVEGDAAIAAMQYCAPRAAEIGAAAELSAGALSPGARAALAALAKDESQTEGLLTLRRALNQCVESEEIGPELARRVFGALGKVSVTRLEAFARCPFAHFVKYALRPEIDEPYGLNARDEGGFYHEAVRAFLESAGQDLPAMRAEDAVRKMDEISDKILEGALKDVVADSGIARAQAQRLRRTAGRAARTLAGQLHGGEFAPVELEMEFGETGASLRLADTPARLFGRIDRVDLLEDGKQRYLRVIDYKRGKNQLDPCEIYYGLQLQLILYLAAALQKYGGKSAGAFYFRVEDPVIVTDSLDENEIERARMDRLRMDGILPADTALIRRMAEAPERAFKVRFLKSGELDKRANAATNEQFDALMRNALACARRFTLQIARGVTQIAPARTALTDACAYCEYRGACMRDDRIPGGGRKTLKPMTMDEVYEKLSKDD